ncbi:MAG TPA: protein-tyrosine phosphatase family protein [Gemmatimonadaceae bacterium]|nr:protein-tyrosine phosphatase family protein [Gemmatimonadaceae bacterium]
MTESGTPHPNSYWLPGGRVLAGEYPFTRDEAAGRARLRRLLDAGITCFIDLTRAGEWGLVPYERALREESEALGLAAEYHRLPIPDMGIPTRARMADILDAIDNACAAGHTVYLHCWGGIGRTGTVVGCHLVRCGMSGDEALALVATLFRSMSEAKTAAHPEGSPQTEEQRAFVREWREWHGRGAPRGKDSCA